MSAPAIISSGTAAGGPPVGGSGTTNTIPRWTGPTTLGDSALAQTGTNAVGFGTPKTWGTSFTLNAIQLSESASISADLNTTYLAANQYWNSPGFQNLRIKANFAARYLLNGATGDHQFQIAPFGAADSAITWTTAMTILNTSGNVGIGTATPVGRADVAGTSVNQSGWGLLSVQSNDAQGADKGGSITFGGVYDASTATHWAQISGRKENGTSGQYGGYLAFATRTNGAGTNTERARIDSAGNVGIGTASPLSSAGAGLTVYGATNGAFYLQNSSNNSRVVSNGNDVYIDAGAGGTGGAIVFRRSSSVTESARIDSSGNIILNSATTNAVIQASGTGQGLKLPATPGNTDPNTLDCYADGGTANSGGVTWTPELRFGGATTGITYTTRVGRYTRVGNTVIAHCYVLLSSKGSATGSVTIAGLPTSSNTSGLFASVTIGYISGVSFTNQMTGYIGPNQTEVSLFETTNAGALSTITDADFTATSGIMFTVSYPVT